MMKLPYSTFASLLLFVGLQETFLLKGVEAGDKEYHRPAASSRGSARAGVIVGRDGQLRQLQAHQIVSDIPDVSFTVYNHEQELTRRFLQGDDEYYYYDDDGGGGDGGEGDGGGGGGESEFSSTIPDVAFDLENGSGLMGDICDIGCEGDYAGVLSVLDSLWQTEEREYELFFTVQGRYAVAAGTIYDNFPGRVQALQNDYPQVETLILVEVPGSANDDTGGIPGYRLVHEFGYQVCVPSDGHVASGGTDFLTAGAKRFAATGARVGIHSWAADDGNGNEIVGSDFPRDATDHIQYLTLYDELCIPQQFYWETLSYGLPIHYITEQEFESTFCYLRDCSETCHRDSTIACPLTDSTPSPTARPTVRPKASPVADPTPSPTARPTVRPSSGPIAMPTASPVTDATASPTTSPAVRPSPDPIAKPTTSLVTASTASPTANFTANYTSPETDLVNETFPVPDILSGLDPARINEFFDSVNIRMEEEGVRGAAYAFRGPGMNAPLLGTYGYTSGSSDSAPVDIDTAFMLASISKTFIGAAMAVVIDQGRLDLDADICDAIGQVNEACRNPAYPDTPVTWRMLINHRSSINRNVPDPGEEVTAAYGPTGVNYDIEVVGNPECPIDDIQQFFEDLFLDKETETTVGNIGYSVNWYDLAQDTMGGVWNQTYAPGEVHEYSNIATAYIAALLQNVTGEKFEQFCASNVFERAGMNHTAWFRRDLPNHTREAVPVYPFDPNTHTWEDVGHFCFADYANGQLHSTIRDMATYADLMLSYGVGSLWSNDTAVDHVFGCQERHSNGTRMKDDDLHCENALSWFHLSNAKRDSYGIDGAAPLEQLDWTNGIEHEGEESGVSTYTLILPEANTYAIVLMNTNVDSEMMLSEVLWAGMSLLADASSSLVEIERGTDTFVLEEEEEDALGMDETNGGAFEDAAAVADETLEEGTSETAETEVSISSACAAHVVLKMLPLAGLMLALFGPAAL